MVLSACTFRITKQSVLAALCASATMFSSAPAMAQGDLLIAPTRVILDGRRGEQIVLSNIGDKEATYRIGLELRRMNPDGSLSDVEPENATDAEKAALDMVRYAPRRVTLPPSQPQSIRVNARPGPDLPDGEYRVHMSFNAIPDATPVTPETSQASAASGGISIELIPIYGITIPLIVRKGRVEAVAGIDSPRIRQTAQGSELEVHLSRTGMASTYGELRVIAPGKSDPVFLARGIAIYPELEGRKLTFSLTPEQAVALHGPVTIEYREMPEAGGGVMASLQAKLP
ncbi:MAG: molecular chaperone [Novosphingobium sp.]